MVTEEGTAEVKHGSVTKYWWFLMIIPLGLMVGTVTSTYNHLKHDRQKDEMQQYRVSEDFNKQSLEDDLRKAFATPNQEAKTTLKGISSSNGLNHYLKLRQVGDDTGALGYYDVKAEEEENQKQIIAVVTELDEENAGSRAAMIAIKISVMKSVFGETDFKHTLRFIFLPSKKSDILNKPEVLALKDEQLKAYYFLRPMDQPSFDKVAWLQQGNIISHPALDRNDEQVLTERQINLTFEAAKQLRAFLLEKL